MIAIVLALCGATVWGGADFLGGLASRRTTALSVVLVSQVSAFVTIALAALVLRGNAMPRDYLFGIGTGAAACAGLTLLYGALARGAMAVVAPVTSLCAVAVPVIVGLASGERPGPLPLAGIVTAVVAIVLVSRGQSHASSDGDHRAGASRQALVMAFGSGCFIGVSYIMLAHTSREAALVPIVVARVTTLVILGAVALIGKRRITVPTGTLGMIAWSGALDTAGNAFYLLAVHQGLLSLVATLASLYPASTVLLARLVLKERMTALQIVGFMMAAAAVVMMTLRQ